MRKVNKELKVNKQLTLSGAGVLIPDSCPDELEIMDVFKVAIAVLQGGAMVGISFQVCCEAQVWFYFLPE